MKSDPLYLAAVLLLLVALAEWLSRRRAFRAIGAALLVILAGAILANLGLIPSSTDAPPLYDAIFAWVAPLAIFFLLLDVRLRDLRQAGLPMLSLFLLGAAFTLLGALAGYYLLAPHTHGIEQSPAVAGMITGTYIGGSVNLNAVALHYGVVKQGTLFAAINAADNIITTVWIMATLFLPRLLQKKFPRPLPPAVAASVAPADPLEASERINVLGLATHLALGLGSLLLAQRVAQAVPGLPAILVLTTIALVLAQVLPLQKLPGARPLGYFFVLIFLAVVGAYCDLAALIASGAVALLLLAWVTTAVGLHGLLLFGIGALFKLDWAMLAVASNANIGGSATAGVAATAIGRDDLRLPGILVGGLGNAIGTYAGLFVAEMLR